MRPEWSTSVSWKRLYAFLMLSGLMLYSLAKSSSAPLRWLRCWMTGAAPARADAGCRCQPSRRNPPSQHTTANDNRQVQSSTYVLTSRQTGRSGQAGTGVHRDRGWGYRIVQGMHSAQQSHVPRRRRLLRLTLPCPAARHPRLGRPTGPTAATCHPSPSRRTRRTTLGHHRPCRPFESSHRPEATNNAT